MPALARASKSPPGKLFASNLCNETFFWNTDSTLDRLRLACMTRGTSPPRGSWLTRPNSSKTTQATQQRNAGAKLGAKTMKRGVNQMP